MDTTPAVQTVTEFIEKNSKEYGLSETDRTTPNPVDGLKKVQRRTIWANKDLKGNLINGAPFVSNITKYHPYGDSSTFEAAVRMGQPFKNNYTLVDIPGDAGTYSGSSHGAMRYIEMGLTDICRALFLDDIDFKTFHKILSEDMSDYEPEYFIPKIPTALLLFTTTIGYGYSTKTLSYGLHEICNLVIAYAKHVDKHGNKPLSNKILAKYLIPKFPTACEIRNYDKVREKYEQGDFEYPLVVDGTMDVSKYTITLYTLYQEISIANVLTKIYDQQRIKGSYIDKNIVRIDDDTDGHMSARIVLTFKRTCDIFEAVVYLKNMIQFTSSIHPNLVFQNKGISSKYTPYILLRQWYMERVRSKYGQKKHKQIDLIKKLTKLKILILVYDYLDEVIEIIHKNEDEEGYDLLNKRFGLTHYQCDILYAMRLKTLSKTSKREYLDEKEKTQKELNELLKSFTKVNQEIAEEAKKIRDKYEPKPNIVRKGYIGAVCINGSGIVQYTSQENLLHILKSFPNTNKEIISYPHDIGPDDYSVDYHLKQPGVKKGCHLPKIMKGKGLMYQENKIKYTIIFMKNTASYIKGCVRTKSNINAVYLYTNKIKCVYDNGVTEDTTVEKAFTERKNVATGAKTDIIGVLPLDDDYPKYVFVTNSASKNQVRVKFVTKAQEGMVLPLKGKNEIISIIPKSRWGRDNYVNIPEKYVKNNKIKHLLVNIDVDKTPEDGILHLNTQKLNQRTYKTVKAYPRILKLDF